MAPSAGAKAPKSFEDWVQEEDKNIRLTERSVRLRMPLQTMLEVMTKTGASCKTLASEDNIHVVQCERKAGPASRMHTYTAVNGFVVGHTYGFLGPDHPSFLFCKAAKTALFRRFGKLPIKDAEFTNWYSGGLSYGYMEHRGNGHIVCHYGVV
jgi:hypothetical protein